ncbi:MAG: ATP-binding protein [Nostoc sp.]
MPAQVIPLASSELDNLIRLWTRETILSNSALLLDCKELDTNDPARLNAIARFMECTKGFLIVTSQERIGLSQRLVVNFDVHQPTIKEQGAVWQDALGAIAPQMNGRGLGISALFASASGTGKTLGAEVLAQKLRLDRYRIDLSSVVSKYIGETEKNLRRVFDAAEQGGVILLFDEADALFGKRSEVKDPRDHYANIEVSYLLQRMESYSGLAVLTTNLKSSIDTAFLRRIRFVVQFPFPDTTQRAEIWRRVFPANTPTADLDALKLARLNVAGGNIRNIALTCSFYSCRCWGTSADETCVAGCSGRIYQVRETFN